MAVDRVLECKNCGKEFIFTAGEQEFFASKGFSNDPTKCKDCRKLAKQQKEDRQSVAVCTRCGRTETVTFTPTYPETILCNDCFEQIRPAAPVAKEETETSQVGTLEAVDLEAPRH